MHTWTYLDGENRQQISLRVYVSGETRISTLKISRQEGHLRRFQLRKMYTCLREVLPHYLDLNSDLTRSPFPNPSQLDEDSDGRPMINGEIEGLRSINYVQLIFGSVVHRGSSHSIWGGSLFVLRRKKIQEET